MNVLFLMADELAWWGVGCCGRDTVDNPPQTPHLDDLAGRGTCFDAAYTPSPMCVPTRAAIACGRYVHEIGYWSSAEPYDGRVASWGHCLQSKDVPVTSIGKLHYLNRSANTGFDEQIDPIHVPDGVGWVRGLLRRPLCVYDATQELAAMIGPGETSYTRFDRRVTESACQWLGETERRSGPWCCFVSWLSPHYPLVVPEKYFGMYDPQSLTGEAEAVPDHPILREIAGFFDHDVHFTAEARGVARAAYRGLCTFLDAQVGQVLRALEASGQAEGTLVIFTSDHGEMLGNKGFWTKSTMYEDAVRVPLIVAGCDVPENVRRADIVSLIDIAPTICQRMGGDSDCFSGRSLLGQELPGRSVISEYHDGGSSVGVTMLRWRDESGDWKYVHYAGSNPPQLFELQEDKTEDKDVSRSRPDIVLESSRRLAKFLDPEETSERAHVDQAKAIERLGGRAALLAKPQWNFTPATGN